jgi:hypothetical protein
MIRQRSVLGSQNTSNAEGFLLRDVCQVSDRPTRVLGAVTHVSIENFLCFLEGFFERLAGSCSRPAKLGIKADRI